MNEAALRARSLTLADGQVVVPIEDVLDLAATPSEEATEPALVLVRYGTGGVFLDGTTNAAIDYSAATPSGEPLDVERLAEVINDLDLVLRPDLLAQTIAAEYERLTRE